MATKKNWFDVDKEGLAKLLGKRGTAFALFELIQNAWDTSAKRVDVKMEEPRNGYSAICVEDDDPDGFKFLHHAWTLFAESEKKSNPEKRGRFNLGEKLVLAMCESATLTTTKGGVIWDKEGRREARGSTKTGSVFRATIKMTKEGYQETIGKLKTLIPPLGVDTFINGEKLATRTYVRTFQSQLPTEISDMEGILRHSKRVTSVELHEVRPGEVAMVYEMGIPVVEIEDKWHVNVSQKVPLNMDRDNVTVAFLRAMRVAVLNEAHTLINKDDATEEWVRMAAGDNRCDPAAFTTVMDKRFGENRVVADPSDPEGTKIALSQGFEIVFAGALSGGEWKNNRKSGAILPAGQVTPSKPETFVRYDLVEPNDAMKRIEKLTKDLGEFLLGTKLEVVFLSSPMASTLADFNKDHRRIRFNVATLGQEWFDEGPSSVKVLGLILHEFGHWKSGDHRSAVFHEAICELGAELTNLALRKPDIFV